MKKSYFLLFLILLLASFLRFFRLEENLVFHAEIGHNYLAIKNFIARSEIPLIGPPTSHPWLEFGPLFYWIMAPVLIISSYNPLGPAVFMELLSVLVVLLNYIVISGLFKRKVALLSSLLISVSPYFLWLGRESRFFSIVVLLVYPYLYLLEGILKGKRHYFFCLGVTLGLMFNFHYTPLVLLFSLPIILFPLLRKHLKQRGDARDGFTLNEFTMKGSQFAPQPRSNCEERGEYELGYSSGRTPLRIAQFFLGLLLPSIPLLIYDAGQKFEMVRNLLLWIPYRIAASAGLYIIHPSNPSGNVSTPENIVDFIGLTVLTERTILSTIFILSLVVFTLFIFYRYLYTKKEKNKPFFIIATVLSSGLVMLAIHGRPPLHYFVPLAPLPLVLISVLIVKLSEKSGIAFWTAGIILFIGFVLNSRYYFSPQWFYTPGELVIAGKHIPYELEKEVAQYIVSDARSLPFNLHRIGAMDSYEGEFAQNYRYLLWLYGSEPKDKETGLTYTIYDNPNQQNNIHADNMKRIGNIMVVKTNEMSK